MNNKFIVFEGVDGAGHTTHAKLLADALTAHGVRVWLTKEPTLDSSASQMIKSILRGERPMPEDPIALQKLYVDDRRHHVPQIKQHLEAGQWVICDRYVLSNIAYGTAMGADYEKLLEMNQGFPIPDLVIYLDLDVKVAMERIHGRGREQELFEQEDKLRMVRESYLRLVNNYPNVQVINSNRPLTEVVAQIKGLIETKVLT